MKKQYYSRSPAETEAIAGEIAGRLKGGDVIAYLGGMGAGKTTLTGGIVRALGGGDVVSSPTFALVNEYDAGPLKIRHFDMYRITDIGSLYSTGFFDYLEDNSSILLIEWSENILSVLPENTLYIHIAIGKTKNERIITLKNAREETA